MKKKQLESEIYELKSHLKEFEDENNNLKNEIKSLKEKMKSNSLKDKRFLIKLKKNNSKNIKKMPIIVMNASKNIVKKKEKIENFKTEKKITTSYRFFEDMTEHKHQEKNIFAEDNMIYSGNQINSQNEIRTTPLNNIFTIRKRRKSEDFSTPKLKNEENEKKRISSFRVLKSSKKKNVEVDEKKIKKKFIINAKISAKNPNKILLLKLKRIRK